MNHTRSKYITGHKISYSLALASALAACRPPARAQTIRNTYDANTAPVPTEAAARETLRLSSEESALRLAGLDLFPNASFSALYDDNLFITDTDPAHDERLAFSPGLTVTAGDVASYLPGSVTLQELRNYLHDFLVEDTSKPRRFAGLDYTPSFKWYLENQDVDHTDHYAGLTAGYAFTRLALDLNADFRQEYAKNNSVGTLLKTTTYGTDLRGRYDLNDRSWLEATAGFDGIDYADERYQGYIENQLGFMAHRQFADRLSLGLGLNGGFVFPQDSPDQTFEQLLVEGQYRLSGKVSLRTAVGAEFRQYDSANEDTVYPVLSVAGVYQPQANTTIQLEAHRREAPSPFADYNHITLGGSLGARQLLFARLYASGALGYDNIDYQQARDNPAAGRSDDYLYARLALQYDFNRHFQGQLFYTSASDDSTYGSYKYHNNTVGLELLYKL